MEQNREKYNYNSLASNLAHQRNELARYNELLKTLEAKAKNNKNKEVAAGKRDLQDK